MGGRSASFEIPGSVVGTLGGGSCFAVDQSREECKGHGGRVDEFYDSESVARVVWTDAGGSSCGGVVDDAGVLWNGWTFCPAFSGVAGLSPG